MLTWRQHLLSFSTSIVKQERDDIQTSRQDPEEDQHHGPSPPLRRACLQRTPRHRYKRSLRQAHTRGNQLKGQYSWHGKAFSVETEWMLMRKEAIDFLNGPPSHCNLLLAHPL